MSSKLTRYDPAVAKASARSARVARGLSTAGKVVGPAISVVGAVADYSEGRSQGESRRRAAVGAAGSGVGGLVGAGQGFTGGVALGALTGPAAPVASPVLGLVGAAGGGFIGSGAGGWAADRIDDLLGGDRSSGSGGSMPSSTTKPSNRDAFVYGALPGAAIAGAGLLATRGKGGAAIARVAGNLGTRAARAAGSFKTIKLPGVGNYNPAASKLLGNAATGEKGVFSVGADIVRSRVRDLAQGSPLSGTEKVAMAGVGTVAAGGLLAAQSQRNAQQYQLRQSQAMAQIGSAAASGAYPQSGGESSYEDDQKARAAASARKAQTPLQVAQIKADAQVEVARIRAGISDEKSSRDSGSRGSARSPGTASAGVATRVADINQKGAIARQQIQTGGQVRVADISQKGAIARQQIQTGGQVRVADINQKGAIARQQIQTGGQVQVADLTTGRNLQGRIYEADARLRGTAIQSGDKLRGQVYEADTRQKIAGIETSGKVRAAELDSKARIQSSTAAMMGQIGAASASAKLAEPPKTWEEAAIRSASPTTIAYEANRQSIQKERDRTAAKLSSDWQSGQSQRDSFNAAGRQQQQALNVARAKGAADSGAKSVAEKEKTRREWLLRSLAL